MSKTTDLVKQVREQMREASAKLDQILRKAREERERRDQTQSPGPT